MLVSIRNRPFTILGTDGGLIPEPVTAAQVLLAPADRVELAVCPFSEGETRGLESLPYDRGMVKEPGGRYATVRVGSPPRARRLKRRSCRRMPPQSAATWAGQVMFSIRLNPDELAELELYAGQHGLPARTLARAWILARLRDETGDQDDLRARVARLEHAVFCKSA